MNELEQLRRPEVKALVRLGRTVWLGAADGLYRLTDFTAEPLLRHPAWVDCKIAALALAGDGLLVAAVRGGAMEIHLVDADGERVSLLPAIAGDEPKSLLAGDGWVLAGGKRGIHRLQGERWEHVHGQGHCEVIGLDIRDGQLQAFAKKQGPRAVPALFLSNDVGQTWHTDLETGYHDGILAASGGRYVTRWRGPWSAGEPVVYSKDAANVALIETDFTAWIAGNKLCLRFAIQGARLDIKDPRFAEAEHLLVDDGHAVVAGGNGAWLVDLRRARVADLFAGHAAAPQAAKLKKLWALEQGRLLATASHGTFWSDDEGVSWTPCESDWAVLDAEGVALSPDGAWYLAAQRGLFVSWNNGQTWKQVKLATRPHFAELTGASMLGDRLVLGSKAGLFVSEPGEAKRLQHQGWLGSATVTGLLATDEGQMWVGTQDGHLYLFDPEAGEGELLAAWGNACTPLHCRDDALTVLAGKRLYQLTESRVETVELPAPVRGVDAVALPAGGLLAWTQDAAWQRSDPAQGWQPVSGWLPRTKSVAFGRRAVATDREAVVALD